MCGYVEEGTVRSRGHGAGGPDPSFLVCKTNGVESGVLKSPLYSLGIVSGGQGGPQQIQSILKSDLA